MTSPDWQMQHTRTDAEAIAAERLSMYKRQHDERFAVYELTWLRNWAAARARAATATGETRSLWRLVK